MRPGGFIPPGPVTPDPITSFLSSFLEAQQNRRANKTADAQIEEAKARTAVAQGSLKLAQEREKTQQAQLSQQQAQTEALGGGIQQLLKSFGDVSAQHAQANGQDPLAGMIGGQQQQGAPQNPQQQAQQPAQDPMAALSAIAAQMPRGAVPEFTKQALPIMQDAAKAQAHATQLANIDKAIAALPANMQQGARSVYTYAQAGANLPAEMQKTLWPELFAGGNDPQKVNAFSTMFKTGSFTAGQAALTAGINLPKSVPSGIKYVPAVSPLARSLMAGVRQGQAANFATEMVASKGVMDAYLASHPEGMSWIGQLRKNTIPGGGLIATIKGGMLNRFVKPDEQSAIGAMYNFSQAWGHAMNGARITDQMFERILHITTPEKNDAPETLTYKQNMQSMMIQGVSDIAKGVRTPTQVINNAMALPFTPDQKKWLQEQKIQAGRFEAAQKAGNAPVGVSSDPVSDPNDLQNQLDQLRMILGAQIATQSPPE